MNRMMIFTFFFLILTIGFATALAQPLHNNSLPYSILSSPQASFTYLPFQPYINMTVTFNASKSTPNGGTIISYKWNFGDTTPPVEEGDPITTHIYATNGTYTVTLNITDSEGLWSAQSKPIDILPPTPLIADFVWYPAQPYPNENVMFDASRTLPSWNGTHYIPIISYKWNFGDGNTTTVSTKTIEHKYPAQANYTVTLTVTDSHAQKSNKTYTIRVSTAPRVKGDINGDGVVNILDAILLAKAFGSRPGSPNWDPRADLNNDGVVNILDAIILANNF